MTEEKIYIHNGSQILEGLLSKASGDQGVIICHPHSLMGGSMYNNVVEAIQEAFSTEHYSTLRFNFRGVGKSTGYYDEGRGEQEDVVSVCKYMKEMGVTTLVFAGYSFGAWVGSQIISECEKYFVTSILISPPINYFKFEWHHLKDKIDLLISGDSDSFCPKGALLSETKTINSKVKTIQGADHFYIGKEEELVYIIKEYLLNKT